MSAELDFVQELEVEIDRLRKRAAGSVLEPGKAEPITFSRKETKLLRRAAICLGHDSLETLIRASVLDTARRALETVGCNSPEEATT